jgi:hypothetical protein
MVSAAVAVAVQRTTDVASLRGWCGRVEREIEVGGVSTLLRAHRSTRRYEHIGELSNSAIVVVAVAVQRTIVSIAG